MHEHSPCPRCSAPFECRVGDITRCQCFGVKLTDAEREYMGKLYTDCLCRSCMNALRVEFQERKRNEDLRRVSQMR